MEKVQGASISPDAATSLPRLIGTRGQFLRLVALYFGVQIAMRILTSPTADLDESEQLVLTQAFQWGYGPHPPLYTWLQMRFFQGLGVSIFSLALLKNLLLFCTYYFTYESARRITGEHRAAVTAALLLFLFPQISWESQRDLTHTVLATTLAAATLNVFLALQERPSLSRYLLLGACLGLGTLSNYNYAFIGLGLVCAGAICRDYRRTVLDVRMLAAIALAVAIVAPHLAWIADHRDLVLASTSKLHPQPNLTLHATWAGLSYLIQAVVFIPAIALIVWLLVTWGKPGKTPQKAVGARNLILLAMGLPLLAIAVLALVFHVTYFRERWLVPVMVVTPVLFVAAFDGWSRPRPARRLLWVVAPAALGICLAIPARIWLAESMHRHELLNAPFDKLTRSITSRSSQIGFVAAENRWIAGNLRLHAAGLPVFCPEFIATTLSRPSTNCLLAWNATQSTAIPPAIKTAFANCVDFNQPPRAIETTEAALLWHHHERMKLGVALMPVAAPAGETTNNTSTPAAP